MRSLLLLVAACSQGRPPSTPPIAGGSAAPIAAGSAVATIDGGAATVPTTDGGAPIAETVLRPLAMAGPFKTIVDACTKAPPCGNTDYDESTNKLSKPPKVASCPAIANSEYIDPAGQDKNGHTAKLDHVAKFGEVRIGSQSCAVPTGLRFDRAVYYAFVKRADGWWRSAPLWVFDYNNKYCSAGMVTRWNDKPDRTFIGIAATLTCLACSKQGSSDETIELMVRVEPGKDAPIVFPPLAVGERSVLTPDPDLTPGVDCKAGKSTIEMTESWPSDDELVLTGAPTWAQLDASEGLLSIGLGDSGKPSTAGRYRFAR